MQSRVWLALMHAGGEIAAVQAWMQQAFYPVLLLILIVASLGVPIPEDIPLLVAGVLLRTEEGIASWHGTILVALVGVLTGDLVLFMLGQRWGEEVVNHRSVRWIITPDRFTRLSRRFLVHGTWFCFFGRFLVGVRAAMCLTAGATGFPLWRFLLADFAGALLSVPLFIGLGYWFAGMVPQLRTYMRDVQVVLWVAGGVAVLIVALVYRARRKRKKARAGAAKPAGAPSADV
jgi:membrane protein DedA with SNARE-associated domain